jgi:ubiquinone/menaquinone biosynthesis C-methylase UbiE
MSTWWERFEGSSGLLGLFAELMVAKDHQVINDWVISLLDFQPKDRVLEIDFGPGYALRKIAGIVKEGFVAGITPSESLWRHAGSRNRAAIKSGHMELRVGTAHALPYLEAFFDKAFSINSIQLWLDPTFDLKEIERVVKKGGVIAVTCQPQSFEGEKRPELAQIGEDLAARFREAGWSDVRILKKSARPAGIVCVTGIKP